MTKMPQTVTQIREMLQQAGLRPHKMFGQNFLIDQNLLSILLDLAAVAPDDAVLEVGPGTGVLTERLLETGAAVLAVEIDNGLACLLRDHFAGNARFHLLHADALAGKHAINPQLLEKFAQLPAQRRSLVSNLPYNIATSLICECLLTSFFARHGRAAAVEFSALTFTVQRELAHRLAAKSGSEDYGPASILVSLLGRIQLGRTLPPEAFWPRPTIVSQMVRIDFDPPADSILPDVDMLLDLLRHAFAQRRKKISSLGKRGGTRFGADQFLAAARLAGINLDSRPEQVQPIEFAALAAALAESNLR